MPSALQIPPIAPSMSRPPNQDRSPSKKRRANEPESHVSAPESHGTVQGGPATPSSSTVDKMSLFGLLNAGQAGASAAAPVRALDSAAATHTHRQALPQPPPPRSLPPDLLEPVASAGATTIEQARHRTRIDQEDDRISPPLLRSRLTRLRALPMLPGPPTHVEQVQPSILREQQPLSTSQPPSSGHMHPSIHHQNFAERYQQPTVQQQHLPSSRSPHWSDIDPAQHRHVGSSWDSPELGNQRYSQPPAVAGLPGLPSIHELAATHVPTEVRPPLFRSDAMRRRPLLGSISLSPPQLSSTYDGESSGALPATWCTLRGRPIKTARRISALDI
jgi:hypothetical protein